MGGICGMCSSRICQPINDAIEPFVDADLPIVDVGIFDDGHLHVRLDVDAFDFDGVTPPSLEDLHELPWAAIEGTHVRVLQEVDDRDPVDPAQDSREDLVRTEEREGELVGRGEGTGLYYSEGHGLIPDPIGPAIYLSTPEETVLEVRTDKLENELLAFGEDDGGGEA